MSFSGKLWRAATELFESRMRLASRGLVTTGLRVRLNGVAPVQTGSGCEGYHLISSLKIEQSRKRSQKKNSEGF